ncbi:MBL fold metallo-hydrolase [Alcanivorax sp. IO_7]|nr:MBL fold metallo-hydrolase [Alcanivorax sp. IO_7]
MDPGGHRFRFPRHRELWRAAFDSALDGRPIRRILVTHYHPDHIGQAAWLAGHFQAPVWMTEGEWALTHRLQTASDEAVAEGFRHLFGRHGLGGDALDTLAGRGNSYRKVIPELPPAPEIIAEGDAVSINGDTWRVHIGRGHAPEHACLYRERDRLLISGDQVLPTISSNLTVRAHEPDDDPVTDFVDSCAPCARRCRGHPGAAGPRSAVPWPARAHRRSVRPPRRTARCRPGRLRRTATDRLRSAAGAVQARAGQPPADVRHGREHRPPELPARPRPGTPGGTRRTPLPHRGLAYRPVWAGHCINWLGQGAWSSEQLKVNSEQL